MAFPLHPLDAVTCPDPWAYYARLRATGPVHWFADIAAWVIVDAAAVAAVMHDPRARVRPSAEPVPGFLIGTAAGDVFAALARMSDGVAHQAARARVLVLMRRLDAATVAAAAARAVTTLGAAGQAHRSAAGLDDLIRGLPVTAMSAALGFPESAWAEMLAATQAWVRGLSPRATSAQQQDAIDAMDRLLASFEAAGIAGSDDAAAHLAMLMQPHEATAGLIGAGLLRLARDGALLNLAKAGDLPWRSFGAEVLRHDPPIQNTRRTLAADMAVSGQPLRAGDTVVLVLAAEARDPAHVDKPDEFRLDRPLPADALPGTLPLGAGPHACPGGDAALAIAEAGWQWVVQHWDAADLRRLADHVTWRPSLNARLPVFASPA